MSLYCESAEDEEEQKENVWPHFTLVLRLKLIRMKIAVVGVTGMVGQIMLRVLQERGFDKHEILAVASERSVGKEPDECPSWKVARS